MTTDPDWWTFPFGVVTVAQFVAGVTIILVVAYAVLHVSYKSHHKKNHLTAWSRKKRIVVKELHKRKDPK